jgi:hypothetical protein
MHILKSKVIFAKEALALRTRYGKFECIDYILSDPSRTLNVLDDKE